MRNFKYNAPTRVIFGKDAEKNVGQLVKEQGCAKVLVHFGGQSAKKSGLLDRIFASLDEAGISYVSLGGAQPNPRLSKVYEGIELCRKEGVDFLLAVGGGSTIDSVKAMAYGLANDCDVWDLFEGKQKVTGCLPLGSVLTIAAAGSEMSNSCVITKEEGWLKRGLNTEYSRPKFAIMNPELTYTLPAYQTASGCVDILSHTHERYFTTEAPMELTDEIAEGLMRTVVRNAQILVNDPENYEARANIMWASSVSHNGLTGCGTAGDWSCHQMEHELGGMFDVAHGAGLAAVYGSWARYVYKTKPERFAQFAEKVFGIAIENGDVEKAALAGIEAMENFYRAIHMPTSIHELGIDLTDEQIEELAEKCCFFGKRKIGSFRTLDKEDIIKIYHMAK